MSTNSQRLCQAILNNPQARAKIAGAATSEDRVDLIVGLGEELGLFVTREDVEQFVAPPPDGELSDLELESVAGGKNDGKGKHIVGHGDDWWSTFFDLTDDSIYAGEGNDTIEGLEGDDTLGGAEGDDSVDGGEGDDVLTGGDGNDTVLGGSGEDVMYGNSGDDSLSGDGGNDDIHGDHGNDTLDGGSGNDTLDGGNDDDLLDGGTGADLLIGGRGSDTLQGGDGDDTLYGGRTSYTDSASDIFVFDSNDGHDTIMDFDASRDRLLLRGAESPDDIEVDQVGGSTFISYGETRIELRDVALTEEQVWKLVDSE